MRFDVEVPLGELRTNSGRTGGRDGTGVIGEDMSEGATEGREDVSVSCDGRGSPAPSAEAVGFGGGAAKSQGRGTKAAGIILRSTSKQRK